MSALFDAALRSWQEAPFPPGSANDEVDEVHADLAQWDAAVAEVVVPMTLGGQMGRSIVDVKSGLAELVVAVAELRSRHPDDPVVGMYLEYALLLQEVHTAAVQEPVQ